MTTYVVWTTLNSHNLVYQGCAQALKPSPDLHPTWTWTWAWQYTGEDVGKGTFVYFRQLYLMLYEICYLDIPSILAQSFYVCTTKEDIIYWMSVKMSWMKSKLDINIRIIFHTMKISLSFVSHKNAFGGRQSVWNISFQSIEK